VVHPRRTATATTSSQWHAPTLANLRPSIPRISLHSEHSIKVDARFHSLPRAHDFALRTAQFLRSLTASPSKYSAARQCHYRRRGCPRASSLYLCAVAHPIFDRLFKWALPYIQTLILGDDDPFDGFLHACGLRNPIVISLRHETLSFSPALCSAAAASTI